MVNARRPGLLAYLLVFLLPGPALAWGDLGHRIICEIAFQELGSIARDRVKAMIDRDPEFATFAESCACPTIPGNGHRSTTSTCRAMPTGSKKTPVRWRPNASSR
jgi:hypothetical protein